MSREVARSARTVARVSRRRAGGARATRDARRGNRRRERDAVAGSFFGRDDAEQWLAAGDGAIDDSTSTSATSIDASLAELTKRRRGLTLFEREMDKEDEDDVDLLACACYVAAHANPDIDVEDVRREIDACAALVRRRLDADVDARFPLRTIKTISRAWSTDLGFKGNVENYYEVENSCVDDVLRRKVGIPITLCLMYMEIAKRVGVDMVDVGIPGHLLCRPLAEGMEVLVDPFNQGDVLFIEEVEDILSKNSLLGEGGKVQIERSFLQETKIRKKAFLTRMLVNLKSIYFAREDYERALQITEYMMACNPYESLRTPLVRTMGVLYFKTERWMDALETFTSLSDADVDDEIDAYIEHIRRVLALERDVVADEQNDDDDDDGEARA